MISAQDWSVIARTSARLLLVPRGTERVEVDTPGRVLGHGRLYREHLAGSILARGYWQESSMPEDELQALLTGAVEVRG